MRTSFAARNILAKKKRLTVQYTISRSNPRFRGACKCGSAEATTLTVDVKSVSGEDGVLSQKDHVAKAAGRKVQSNLGAGKRLCEHCFKQTLEVASRPDALGQVFAS